ncbi:MAG TPA: amino acid permease [Gemmatimonadales bacterium]|nr:amino acid permease [Gemmatimonadales bacterium]
MDKAAVSPSRVPGPGTASERSRTHAGAPRPVLTTLDGVVLIVGLVLGAGIFRAPQLVAAGSDTAGTFLLLWVIGGVVSLVGALCYAELAAAYPSAGGEYHFLTRAFGRRAGFLCAWSRLTVIQTGSIAILAFLVGDYAGSIGWGDDAPAWASAAIAAAVVILLTGINIAGLRQGTRMQYGLTTLEVLALLAVIAAGVAAALSSGFEPAPQSATAHVPSSGPSLAFIFVLLTFGGWSEAAYLSAEFHDRRRGVVRTLGWGLAVITLLYLLTNAAYLVTLGLGGVAKSTAVAADVMRAWMGEWGAVLVSVGVMVAALSSANATMITGARSNYALGRDVPFFGFLAGWHEAQSTPKAAFVLQGAIALGLVGFGALTRGGFEAMVAYTAPVFWLILFGTGAALILLRRREPSTVRPFRVPLYPVTPILFCIVAGYMLHASVAYAGRGALLGIGVMLAGIPVLALARSRAAASQAQPIVSRGTP